MRGATAHPDHVRHEQADKRNATSECNNRANEQRHAQQQPTSELGDVKSEMMSLALAKQQEDVARAAHLENLPIPDELDYAAVTALSIEVRQKLSRHRPATVGQASRISGITPAAISLLLVHLKKTRAGGRALPETAGDLTGPGLDGDG